MKLLEAAMVGKSDQAKELIAEISDIKPLVAKLLNKLVDEYRFDKLVDFLEKSSEGKD